MYVHIIITLVLIAAALKYPGETIVLCGMVLSIAGIVRLLYA